MEEKRYELIETWDDIDSNALEFKRILTEERSSYVIESFNKFDYWYYYSDLDIFIPNLFLGYKNGVCKDISPRGSTNGADARVRLEKYFDSVWDKNKASSLYIALEKFVKRHNKELKNPIKDIYVLKQHKSSSSTQKKLTATDRSYEISKSTVKKDNFEIINKAFRTILHHLAYFIGETLKRKDNKHWWKNFVINKLPKSTSENLPHEGSDEVCIKKLDIQACLNIIEYNWLDIFKYKFNKDGKYRTWARELKDIRNDYDAHYTIQTLESFNDDDLTRALDTMVRFMKPINEDISKEIKSIKDSIGL
jgi:hypothetical protein